MERARQLGLGLLTCFSRRTITGLLTARGKQFMDWSAAYRLFKYNRMNVHGIFDVVRQKAIDLLPVNKNILLHLDDTIIRKKGKKVAGTAWRRDPLGPPFHTNFVWGQRFIQTSMAIPQASLNSQSRALPIDFHHSPSAKRPGPRATEAECKKFKEMQAETRLSYQGVMRIIKVRKNLDNEGYAHRKLCVSVDGSYTNKTVLKQLPAKTTLIGRIRKDTKLYKLPGSQSAKGRKKTYGERIPTPEEIRKDNAIEYRVIKAWAAGKVHDFKIKVIKDLRWRAAGHKNILQLLIISPLGYRLTKGSKILYRDPAYLICTDNDLSTEEFLQSYLWRWEIEVNIRDEKTLLGCGQAQVRNAEAVEKAPAFCVAMYSFLHLSSMLTRQTRNENVLPRPKWDPARENQRLSTTELMNLFRLQNWSTYIKAHFSGFMSKQHEHRSSKNYVDPLISAAFYLRN